MSEAPHRTENKKNTRQVKREMWKKAKAFYFSTFNGTFSSFLGRDPTFLFCSVSTNYLTGPDTKQHLGSLAEAEQVHFWEAVENVSWWPRLQGSFKEMRSLCWASESDGTGVMDTLRKGTEVGTLGLPGVCLGVV